MSIYGDMREWDKAQADLTSDAGTNAAERVVRRLSAAQRMRVIEDRYEKLPGGFQAETAQARERVKRIVDGSPPLTDEQLVELAKILWS
jgi:hypothetical protein